ncbi:hypothetical protein BaRGS_00004085 [Batillaria attramentaria]|uniref:Uncharacterized protein n=1 Tax=Batillaria attramentaria TaxID=370345 RepID=A0ABD0LYR4_9CAEN
MTDISTEILPSSSNAKGRCTHNPAGSYITLAAIAVEAPRQLQRTPKNNFPNPLLHTAEAGWWFETTGIECHVARVDAVCV